jgi:hypothetical protein
MLPFLPLLCIPYIYEIVWSSLDLAWFVQYIGTERYMGFHQAYSYFTEVDAKSENYIGHTISWAT